MKTILQAGLISLLATSLVTGCDLLESDDDENSPQLPGQALVHTTAADYSSSEVALIDVENEQVQTGYYISPSDYTVLSYGSDVYHIGRNGYDTVTRYSGDSLDAEIWSYSTQDNEDTESRNLYTLAFASDNKAYAIRYGSDKVWIVNPEATQAEDFKIGELDLSSYLEDDFGGTPNPSAAVVDGGKLFIVMQRLDVNYTGHTAYVAVFDVDSDEEIETNASDADSVKGIPLSGLNPLENSLVAHNDEIFVTSRTGYFAPDLSGSKIEAINTSDYSVRDVVLASTVEAPISSTVIVNDSKGYFITNQAGYDDNQVWVTTSGLFEFNPTTGAILGENLANTGQEEISFIALDDAGYVWISIVSAQTPGVEVIDTDTNALYVERLLTDLNPKTIAFIND